MAGLCEGGNEPAGSLKAMCVRNCVSIRRPEFECSGPQLEGPEFECSGPQLEGPEFEYSGLSLKIKGQRRIWVVIILIKSQRLRWRGHVLRHDEDSLLRKAFDYSPRDLLVDLVSIGRIKYMIIFVQREDDKKMQRTEMNGDISTHKGQIKEEQADDILTNPRRIAVGHFRMVTDHYCLAYHLHRIGILDSPLCPLCNRQEDMQFLATEYVQREDFAVWMQVLLHDEPDVLIFMSDEAHFHLNGFVNLQTSGECGGNSEFQSLHTHDKHPSSARTPDAELGTTCVVPTRWDYSPQ
ncbi:hypothetical protein ANN_02990 [Periplaneta americana]|uniref:Uncharacterized protein n=1 Tax=Periplaneta americana TaxID=6978 RepID=A0ABQ8TXT2_PERAM|nr:hypothetical protein ANN_02990 [Periplaneta americana]